MPTKQPTTIEFKNLDLFFDKKLNVVAYVQGEINQHSFESVAYFENTLYSTIDIFSIANIKPNQKSLIKKKIKKEIESIENQKHQMIQRIDDSAIVCYEKLFKELDAKHNGYLIALNVPDKDSNIVKELGGIWSPVVKQWVVLSKNPNIQMFRQWTVGAIY